MTVSDHLTTALKLLIESGAYANVKAKNPNTFEQTNLRKCELEIRAGIAELGAPAPAPAPSLRWWADSSPWNQPIPVGAKVHPDSAAMLAPALERPGPVFDPAYGVNVYYSDASTPIRTCYVTDFPGALGSVVPNVPIPDEVEATGGSDHKWAVISPEGWVWEAWRARKCADGDWDVGSIGATSLKTGTGFSQDGTTAAWASSLGGLIRGEELFAGKIEHALAVSLPTACVAPGFVAPALKGPGIGTGKIPVGTRLQLDSAYDLARLLGVVPRIIGRAMQEYGLYVIDRGGAIDVKVEANQFGLGYLSLESFGVKQALRVLA